MMNHDDYPRVLVLSNNSFSPSNSNGRTLGSLLQGWPKDRLAQFCISSDGADFDVCNNYFCVTDADVLRATLRLRPQPRRHLQPQQRIDANAATDGTVRHRKTSLNMLARNLAWMLGLWRGKEFNQWIDSFAPDIILLQSGDSFFMHHLAMKLARRTGARLAIFNTEGNYLFKKDYFKRDGFFGRQLFKVYSALYRQIFRQFMRRCDKQIYGNQSLKDDYGKEFRDNSIVIYTASTLAFEPTPISNTPIFSYLGNLGFDRPKALIEFADVLHEINPNYFLDIYGVAKNNEMINMLNNSKSVRFHGSKSYEEVRKIIRQSDFLIHAECQDDSWEESLLYGFSTKIADSIASGKAFVLYSSPKIACAKYIQENHAGLFAKSRDDLKSIIIEYLENQELRNVIRENAKKVYLRNHNPERNIRLMRDYLAQK